MNSNNTSLIDSDNKLLLDWLSGQGLEIDNSFQDTWAPGFDGGRQVVLSRLGPYQKLFQLPEKFTKHFYHTIFPLSIDDWNFNSQFSLYGGFCKIDSVLKIRFQATLKYAQMNMGALGDINTHIKNCYAGVIQDAIDKEILNLGNGDWIQTGLSEVEKRIERTINEQMIMQEIQCRTVCSLQPSFAELTDDSSVDDRFTQEAIYLNVLQKKYRFREKQQREQFLQEEKLQEQKLDHKKKQLEQLDLDGELERLQQARKADNILLQLQEQEQQLAEQFKLEQKLQVEKIKKESDLRELQKETELRELAEQQKRQQEIEKRIQLDKINHEKRLKQQQLDHEIEEVEKRQARWNEIKDQMNNEKLKREYRLKMQEQGVQIKTKVKQQIADLKMRAVLLQQKIKHENQLKEMELKAEAEQHEQRFLATQKTDDYLRREIELLLLEKQRAELNQAIKDAERAAGNALK
jgi:hypothetical protein